MNRLNSITGRAFLFSFVPVLVVMAASFWALNALIERRVKESSRAALQKSEELIVRANEEASRRVAQLMAVMAQNAGLKAAIGLLQEIPSNAGQGAEVRSTIEAQLREMHDLAGDDLLAVTDWKGRTVAAIGADGAPRQLPDFSGESSLVETGGQLYLLSTAPIVIGGAEIGTLGIGRKFELDRYHVGGEMLLLRGGQVLRSTLPHDAWASMEQQIAKKCPQSTGDCEIEYAGETLLVLPVREAGLAANYRLLALRSLDGAVRELTQVGSMWSSKWARRACCWRWCSRWSPHGPYRNRCVSSSPSCSVASEPTSFPSRFHLRKRPGNCIFWPRLSIASPQPSAYRESNSRRPKWRPRQPIG